MDRRRQGIWNPGLSLPVTGHMTATSPFPFAGLCSLSYNEIFEWRDVWVASRSDALASLEESVCLVEVTFSPFFRLPHCSVSGVNTPDVCMLSRVCLFVIPRTVAHQAPSSMGFPCQEYWTRLPFPPPGGLPNPGVEPMSSVSRALAGGFFTRPGSPQHSFDTVSCRSAVL